MAENAFRCDNHAADADPMNLARRRAIVTPLPCEGETPAKKAAAGGMTRVWSEFAT